MRLFHSVIDPGRRWLAKHLHRLRRTLEALSSGFVRALPLLQAAPPRTLSVKPFTFSWATPHLWARPTSREGTSPHPRDGGTPTMLTKISANGRRTWTTNLKTEE